MNNNQNIFGAQDRTQTKICLRESGGDSEGETTGEEVIPTFNTMDFSQNATSGVQVRSQAEVSFGESSDDSECGTAGQEMMPTLNTMDVTENVLSRIQDGSLVPESVAASGLSTASWRGVPPYVHYTTNVLNVRNVNVKDATNVSVGGKQVISNEELKGSSLVPSDTGRKQHFRKRSGEEIRCGASGMVKTKAVETVLQKFLLGGLQWVTITGNPGTGKSTVGYLVLEEMQHKGYDTFIYKTPEEYFSVTSHSAKTVILFNDIFGAFNFNQVLLDSWLPVFEHIVTNRDDMKKEIQAPGASQKKMFILLTTRNYILQESVSKLGKFSSIISGKTSKVDLSQTDFLSTEERKHILEYHLNRKMVPRLFDLDKLIGVSSSHGFPHCCKMFSELKENWDVPIGFFKSPLIFLDQTTSVLLDTTATRVLFYMMLIGKGHLTEINTESQWYKLVQDEAGKSRAAEVNAAAENLVGSYLSEDSIGLHFIHPSINDSVATQVCKKDPMFVIEHLDIDFLKERLVLADPIQGSVVLKERLIPSLVNRFLKEIVDNKNLQVLTHSAVSNENVVKKLLSMIEGHVLHNVRDKLTGIPFLYVCTCNKSRSLLQHTIESIVLSPENIKNVVKACHEFGSADCLDYLMEKFPDLDMQLKNSETPLILAAKRNQTSRVEALLKVGYNARHKDQSGKNALHHSSEQGYEDNVNLLIKSGIDINSVDDRGKTALHYSCRYRHEAVVKTLLTCNCDKDIGDLIGQTPLHVAAWYGHIEVVDILVKAGCNVNKCNREIHTPLHTATLYGHTDVVDILLKADCNYNMCDMSKQTPLHIAVWCSQTEVAERLVKAGCDGNMRDMSGLTPLHIAAWCGQTEVVDLLVKAGFDVNMCHKSGQTPLHIAAWYGKTEVVDLLVKAGCNVNMCYWRGQTPSSNPSGSY